MGISSFLPKQWCLHKIPFSRFKNGWSMKYARNDSIVPSPCARRLLTSQPNWDLIWLGQKCRDNTVDQIMATPWSCLGTEAQARWIGRGGVNSTLGSSSLFLSRMARPVRGENPGLISGDFPCGSFSWWLPSDRQCPFLRLPGNRGKVQG